MKRDRLARRWAAGAVALLALTAPVVAAGPPAVVVTIKPVHALVAGVMGDTGAPKLLVDGTNSPHTFRLKPSDATALQAADLVVQVGAGLEQFLARPLAAIATGAEVLALAAIDGMTLLPVRDTAIWTAPADGHDHGRGDGTDPHLWLDPDNARAAVAGIATVLARLDSDRAAVYAANAAALDAELAALDLELKAVLLPVRQEPFVVFHDGYQYLESHFGLAAAGALAISPERRPSAAHLRAIQATIATRQVGCVFAEPQFEPRLIAAVVEGLDTRTAVLDPLGLDVPAGRDAYAAMMRKNTEAIRACLAAD